MMAENKCGICTACCKTMRVEELNKPPSVWCSHCVKGTGCSIYQDRPQACRDFRCVWLASQDRADPGERLPIELRPNHSKVVLNLTPGGEELVVLCDAGYPAAWREPKVFAIIETFAKAGKRVHLRTGGRMALIDLWRGQDADAAGS